MRLEVSAEADLDVDTVLQFGINAYGEPAADRYVTGMLSESVVLLCGRLHLASAMRFTLLFASGFFVRTTSSTMSELIL